MTEKYLIVISKNYWGAHTSEKSGHEFLETFADILQIKREYIKSLFGNQVNVKSVKEILYNTIKNLPDEISTVFVYMNGHGNQTGDQNKDELAVPILYNETPKDANDELYQLPDGSIIDDELTTIFRSALNETKYKPVIFLISDHCSSGSMIDNTYIDPDFHWVSIGSSLDYQDSYITGDGNVMTINLLNVLRNNRQNIKNINVLDFYRLLDKEMKASFIGEIQSSTFHVSDSNMFQYKPF